MRKKKPLIATGIILTILLIIVIAILFVFHNITGTMKTVKLDQSDEALGITLPASDEEIEEVSNEEKIKAEKNIETFLLFGVNSTDVNPVDINRSDSIMIVSINETDKIINIISILRDTKAAIEGHDDQKINAAYHYGGAQLAVKTINQNFKTSIRDYVSVDFAEMASIVDMLGGVDIELTEEEAQVLGTSSGLVHLDGNTAVEYSRIRKIDSDYYRAGRQQTVLQALFTGIKSRPVSEYPTILKQLLSLCETSYDLSDFMSFLNAGVYNYQIVFNKIPDPDIDKDVNGGIDESGEWVWTYDMDAAAKRINSIIYGE